MSSSARTVIVLGLLVILTRIAQASNPIQIENALPGTTAWQLSNPATNREIEGYASLTSVNQGGQISLFVNTADPTFTIEIYRIGWYGGAGGRQVLGPVSLPGTRQVIPAPDATGMIECRWINPYNLVIPSSWLSGVYLAKLTESNGGKQSYIIFTVREDLRPSAYLFTSSVTTYQAYNNWPGYNAGGKSLYNFNSFDGAAVKVSFNRPYALGFNPASASGVGAGDFVTNLQPSYSTAPAGWEINMVRFLEREGYDVTYCTSVDLHENGAMLLSHRAYLSVGHDEYWSWQMRANVQAARDQGVGLGFFSSNVCYWQIRLEASPATGAPDRTMVGYKESYTLDPDYLSTDPNIRKYTTYLWRVNFGGLPSEQALIGVEYITSPLDADIIITAAPSHWALQNTGLVGGDHLTGLLGYEVDGMLDTDSLATISVIAQTPLSNGGTHPFSEMVAYVAPSGATVFATGSMQWTWGLDDYNVPLLRTSRLNPSAQQITRNVLARLITNVTGGSAQYLSTDTATKGNWKGIYGGNGYIIPNDSSNPAAYAITTVLNGSSYTWSGSTADNRALLKSLSTTDRIASAFYSTERNGLNIDIKLTDGLTHQIALYVLDWDNSGRAQSFTLLDGETLAVRDTRTISQFTSGQYLVWNISGHVIINTTATAGPNAVINGIFFQGFGGPDLTIAKSHTGNFAPGETGDTYTITVTNSGGRPASGSVTVTDTLPSGLIATAIRGTGWSCIQPAGPCSRTDVLNSGASYPPIALVVNVANNASSSVTNTATVSGGGDVNTANNTASDATTILPPPAAPVGFLTAYALNGPALRNNFSGWVGMALTVGDVNLIVDSIGRVCIAGNSGTHIVKFVNAITGADVPGGSVSINMAGCIAGRFVYSYLPNSITLQAGSAYYLASQEINGGDQWYDMGGVASTTDATVTKAVYSADSLTWIAASPMANMAYVPANFQYLRQTLTQFLLTTTVSPAGAGSITANPPSPTGYYTSGTVVQLTAAPNLGYTLTGWSGDLTGTANPQTITMSAPRNITANFQAAGGPASLLTGYNLNHSPLRNNFSGWVGMKLTIGARALKVSALGRVCVAGNSGTHAVKLVDAVTGLDITGGSASVNMSGCTAGQFVYSTLPGSITLVASGAYYLVSQELQGGDQWYDHGTVASTSDAAVNSSIWFDGTNWNAVDAANTAYVPPNMLYSLGNPPFLSGYNLNNRPLRNDYTGWVGMALRVGPTSLTVHALGRIFVAGNSATHTVKLVRASDGADLPGASVSISMQGGAAGQFSYAALAAPVTLQANTTYYLVSQEVQGGDQWYDYGTVATSSSAANVTNAVYWNGSQWIVVGGANSSYVPPNFN